MKSPTQQILLRQTAKCAALLLERQRQSDRRLADEKQRHSDMVAKTARLRKQRVARNAAEAEAARGETKQKGGGPSK